ncbi:HAT C-terminal dimerization domain [Arabidopsis suecica]|uniref:HAT C-terminal dimerization domain n=1 Tax=Arabidopsis suecica TaxID=45249 RepID=A0A8T2B6Z7_ARASU|nr:HAT C-terminal dimerization domain [Arabidopsis suecica]
MSATVIDIHEHGIRVDKKKSRVKCNHCGKEMNSFNRLKHHLGAVGTDVTHCDQVSLTLRETFRTMLIEEKSGHTTPKRVGKFQMGNSHKRRKSEDSSSESVSPDNGNVAVEADKQNLLSNKAHKCIGRFFYEHCVDLSAVDSPCFKEMMMAVGGGQKIPDSHDLKGWMLQEALKEAHVYVKKIKDSWKITGCSILLDAWIDPKGRDLVAFVADCPAGPVYLKSIDVSVIKNDVTALLSLVNGLVEEVGVRNVTQIIACSTSGWVGELGKLFSGHDREVFWSVSLSHCFELMLVNIRKTRSFGDILDKVNTIWEFINNNPSVLKIFRDHSHGKDITVSSSEFEFVRPYLILKSIFKAKKYLAAMFASSDWNKEEGIAISNLVNDSSFWETVENILNCTYPLIHGLLLFSNADNNQHVGYIYDTLDGIKESIAKKFNHEKQHYITLWDVIDDVWNKHLHNPLHAAGYYLNPTSFYSTDFHLDPEVSSGLTHSLVHVAKEGQIKIAAQLDRYRLGKDCFNEASQPDQISGIISPIDWWTEKASQHPELQSFAIKILSQTCEGASRYKLKRSLAEKLLLTEGMSHCERKHLEELAFVHYNLHLQSCKAKLSEEQ